MKIYNQEQYLYKHFDQLMPKKQKEKRTGKEKKSENFVQFELFLVTVPPIRTFIGIFAKCRSIGGNRFVFNIKGNSYRLVVKMSFELKTVWIRFIGTHNEYDKIDSHKI